MRRRRAPAGRRASNGVRPPGTPGRGAADPHPAEIARFQAIAYDWSWMWSPWRRTWTAIARFGTEPLILDHPDPYQLLRQCRAAELAAAQHPPYRP